MDRHCSWQITKQRLRELEAKTQNGRIVKTEDVKHGRITTRLEKQIQMAKVKLSMAKTENIALKQKIDTTRRNKLIEFQILCSLVRQLQS